VFIIVSVSVLLIALFFLRVLFYSKKNISEKSFSIALQSENNGDYEDALLNYEIALVQVKKMKHNKDLKSKILEKIKVLHTVIQYQKNLFNVNKNTY
jgi:hypothetical protein